MAHDRSPAIEQSRSRSRSIRRAIDSLDSLKLAEKLNASAEKLGKKINVLIEVNVGGEAAKSGVAPDSDELENLLTRGSEPLSASNSAG